MPLLDGVLHKTLYFTPGKSNSNFSFRIQMIFVYESLYNHSSKKVWKDSKWIQKRIHINILVDWMNEYKCTQKVALEWSWWVLISVKSYLTYILLITSKHNIYWSDAYKFGRCTQNYNSMTRFWLFDTVLHAKTIRSVHYLFIF